MNKAKIIDRKVAAIISCALEPALPGSMDYTPTYASNGLFFTMFNLGIWTELQLDSYWLWLLDDLADISDAIIDAGALP